MKKLLPIFLLFGGAAFAQTASQCFQSATAWYPCSLIPTVQVVQTNHQNSSGTGTSLTNAWTNKTTAGNTILCFGWESAGATPTVSDGQSNTYVVVPTLGSSTVPGMTTVAAQNIVGGTTDTITLSYTSGAGSFICYELKGTVTFGQTWGVANLQQGTGSSISFMPSIVGETNAMVFVGVGMGGGTVTSTPTLGTSTTSLVTVDLNNATVTGGAALSVVYAAHATLPTATSFTQSLTLSASETYSAALVSVRPALQQMIPWGSVDGTLQSAATANGNGTAMDVKGFATAFVQINCSVNCSGGTTQSFEVSQDSTCTNYTTINAYQVNSSTVATTVTNQSGVSQWAIPLSGARCLMVPISSYSAGTVTVTATATLAPFTPVAGPVGQTTMSASIPVTIASNQSNLSDNIVQFGSNNVVTGTGASGNGIPRVTVSNDSVVGLATGSNTIGTVDIAASQVIGLSSGSNTIGAVTQASGPWTNNITQFGSNNIVTGTGASGNGIPRVTVSNDSVVGLATGSNTIGTVDIGASQVIGLSAGTNTVGKMDVLGNAGAIIDFAGQNASSPANSFLTGCQFNTTPTTISTTNSSPVQCDSAGNALVNLKTALPAGSNTIGAVTGSGVFEVGPTTAANTVSNTFYNQISDGTNAMGTMANFGTAPASTIKSLNVNASMMSGTTALGAPNTFGTTAPTGNALGVNASLFVGTAVVSGTAPVPISATTAANSATNPVFEAIAGNGSVLSGQQAVTATAAALATNTAKNICVKALDANTINVYLGPSGVSDTTGMELGAGQFVCLPVTNTNLIYVIASTTGASVSWVGTN